MTETEIKKINIDKLNKEEYFKIMGDPDFQEYFFENYTAENYCEKCQNHNNSELFCDCGNKMNLKYIGYYS